MYKKIKNSSFMNLFWFLLCLFPIILMIVYSIQFFNTKKYEFNEINNNATINENEDLNYNVILNDNYFICEKNVNNDLYSILSYNLTSSNYFYLYLSNLNYIDNNSNSVLVFSYNGTYYEDNIAINQNNFNNENIFSFTYNKPYDRVDIQINYVNFENFNNFECMLFASDIEINNFTFMNFGNYKNQTITTINYNLDFESFLSSVLNSFASNGFIYNSLFLLINYFGVTSVYLKLAILYIEYFIILNLLHLFVDFVLLVPNICHKFMEKIGGERD